MIIDDQTYLDFKEVSVSGRYVTNNQVIAFLEKFDGGVSVQSIGNSVQNRAINSITLGNGIHKILMWSQMHGNESTTTKAVLDLVNFLTSKNSLAVEILKHCTLKIIPILSPDGAEAYTRINANQIDLNRDAQNLSQPESKVLRKIYDDFQPDFCFNLHDQRTIFNVGTTNKPATVSFLAPSHDEERSISKTRKLSMHLIAAMNVELQERIPGQVGRYDDGFNANCVGDTFQMMNTPTILFEAGHFHEDYSREKTRTCVFHSLIAALSCITKKEIDTYSQESYFQIPENNKMFYDILIKHAHHIDASFTNDIGILFIEVLEEGRILFEPRIDKTGDLKNYFGHKTFNCNNINDLETLKKDNIWNLLQR